MTEPTVSLPGPASIDEVLLRASGSQMDIQELVARAEMLKVAGQDRAVFELYKTWLAFHGDHPLVHAVLFNFAIASAGEQDLPGAIQALQASIRLKADFYPPYINAGNYLEASGRSDLALLAWRELVGKLPAVTRDNIDFKTTALKQIARVLESAGDDAEAETTLAQAISLAADQPEAIQHWIALRQRQCKWPLFSHDAPLDQRRLAGEISPLSLACHVDDPMFQLANAWRYNRKVIGWPKQFYSAHDHPVPAVQPERLRIGYVSSDFRDHAVGFSMAGLFELHDRSKVEVFGYYCGSVRQSDGTQARIQEGVDHWIDISAMEDATAATRIRSDAIHILVDLNGYTRDARTALFAIRPAAINVNWFGFPGTMGSPYHHYIIADDSIIPPEFESFYSETVVRLPCYQPNDRKRVVSSKRPDRMEAGLPPDAFVYCCLNGMQKLNAATFALWMRILQQVPGSVLWLMSGTEETNSRLRAAAAGSGVAPERLVFADKQPNPDHLARFELADLFLDTMPYGAHTTAADSLWMGVPVLTIPGQSFASRVCASLVRAAGMADMVARDLDAYVAKAVALGRDRPRNEALRRQLRDNRDHSALFDCAALVLALEQLYQGMWDDFCRGKLPRPDFRNLDLYQEIAVEIDHDAFGLVNADAYPALYLDQLRRRDQFATVPIDGRLWSIGAAAGTNP